MKTLLTLAGAAALALGLSACSTATTTKLLDNLSTCQRDYDGTVSGGMSGGQFTGAVKIHCTGVAPGAAAAAAAQASAAQPPV